MITRNDVFPLLLVACPSFAEHYAASVENYGEELLYTHAGNLASHLLALQKIGTCSEFPATGAFLESLCTDGEPYVVELAIIGFLEGIQNVWGHSDVKPELFLPFLGPVASKAWDDLNRFWNGETKRVGGD